MLDLGVIFNHQKAGALVDAFLNLVLNLDDDGVLVFVIVFRRRRKSEGLSIWMVASTPGANGPYRFRHRLRKP